MSKPESNVALSEQQQVRREKLESLRTLGYPYPNDVRLTATCSEAFTLAEETQNDAQAAEKSVTVAGRMLAIRHMGKAAFCQIQDRTGKLQIYVKKDDVGEESFTAFKHFDLGDIVEVSGCGFITKTGEPSLHASSVRLLVKCLHPLPEKWHGLTDIEVRYRQRYLDLIVNPESKAVFVARAKIIKAIRDFFDARDYIEVETPTLSTIASGASARPFSTHHNALDLELTMRIALELPLKRLVVGGIERVFELGRVFRNEGISTQHNPEFTMLEFYQAYATYEDLMTLTEDLLVSLCDKVVGSRVITFNEKQIDFSPPFKRLSMAEAVHEIGGISREFNLDTIDGIHAAARSVGLEIVSTIKDYGKALYELF
jgi:lysyl-tRNA synthetase class 2